MHALEVFLLGPDGIARTTLAETIRGLGHEVTEAGPNHESTPCGDVVMVDLRDGDWSEMRELADDGRPAVLLSSEPRRAVRTLAGRRSGLVMMSQAADERALRVALRVCAGLSRTATAAA